MKALKRITARCNGEKALEFIHSKEFQNDFAKMYESNWAYAVQLYNQKSFEKILNAQIPLDRRRDFKSKLESQRQEDLKTFDAIASVCGWSK